jgi:methylmalonyl-CoA mutase C-terminal domain/subunit
VVAVDLHAIALGVVEVERLAHEVVGGPVEPPAVAHPSQRLAERRPGGDPERGVKEPGLGGTAFGAVRVAPEDEQGNRINAEDGLVAVAVEDGEADDVAVEGSRLVEVGDAERDAADPRFGRQAVVVRIVRHTSVDGRPRVQRVDLTRMSVRIKRRDDAVPDMSVEQEERAIRCLVAKVGLDGHDRGAHVIARAFRDAGFEVVYSGLHRAPDDIVQAAVQEDVDVLGISILSGAHNTLVPKVIEGLKEYDAFEDTLILVGGIIPDDDEDDLKALGVAEVFGPGTPMEETVEFIRNNVPERA